MNNQDYTTKDFYLAAFLLLQGVRIVKLDRSNPQKISFVFQDMESRGTLVEDFLFSRAVVEPKAFVSAIKEIKQLLHSND